MNADARPTVGGADSGFCPTPYPDVNAVLRVLLSGVQAELGDRFAGLYLYGSLASGDFDPQCSDIDFVVATVDVLADETVVALEALHARIADSGLKWAAKLEGAYVPLPALRRHDPSGPPCPCVNEGRFYLAALGSDWVIQRYTLREQGVAVAGQDPRSLIDPVEPDDLRQAVMGFLREWWAPMLQDPDPRLHDGEYQAYAVLTMCRALYTLQYGAVVSKTAAARWAQEALGQPWEGLIERALAWRRDALPDGGGDVLCMDETLGFIRCVLDQVAA
jgi:hypothetical protein